uniref:Cupin type-1 domain-containing protein n=1 Tax=Kalanchoe fedtschenkoi TaxID=63787 RepID=A0A7N0UL14_KALFE
MASTSLILRAIALLLIIVGSSAKRYSQPTERDDSEAPRWRPSRPREGDEPEPKFDPRTGPRGPKEDEPWFRERRSSPFLLQEAQRVVRTDAGEMSVVRGFGLGIGGVERPLHIGFITMERKSLFVPQYLDSSLIIFVQLGMARIGMIYKAEFVERDLKSGDLYRIPAGSAFYLVNTEEGQRLNIVCSIDPSESIGFEFGAPFQAFYIGGGKYPASVLRGFDPHTLATAFNVTVGELGELMTTQTGGPIVFTTDPQSHAPSMWTSFLNSKHHDKARHLKKLVSGASSMIRESKDGVEDKWKWWDARLVRSLFGAENENKKGSSGRGKGGPDSYNLYDRSPDFKNNYGWSVALEEHDYSFLQHSGISIYLVNLTAGSMMAPHINPTATEYGIVLRGSGSLQIVHPNGTSAINTQIKEGDVFLVPRYFPFCQIASRTGPLEFFGFTTSSRRNRPQFLAGAGSLLQALRGPELAAAFGVSVETLESIAGAQKEAVILPTAEAAPGDVERE